MNAQAIADLLVRFAQERPMDAAQMFADATGCEALSPEARDLARLQHVYLTNDGFRNAMIDHVADLVWNLST